MKALLLGLGEIGKGVKSMCMDKHAIQVYDPRQGMNRIDNFRLEGTEVLLVAIPWSNDFVSDVSVWQTIMAPHLKATIIFSTVPIGTCSKINAVHFPVEAKHPHIYRDMRLNHHAYMGGENETAKAFMLSAGFKFTVLHKSEFTEFLKLRSTAIYGLNIEFARYTKECCDRIGMDFEAVKQYDMAHNELCKKRGTPEHARYILDPPDGAIGGHCVVPNAVLLQEQFPNNLVAEIVGNNTKVGDEDTFVGDYTIPIMKRNVRRIQINARGLQWGI